MAPLLFAVLCLSLATRAEIPAAARVLAGIGMIGVLLGAVSALRAFIALKTSEFAVTNKRVLIKTGFIRRNSLEVLLSKVEGIQVHQSLVGRLLNFGSIVVTGTGGSHDPYHRIAAPLGFRRAVQEQVAAVQETR